MSTKPTSTVGDLRDALFAQLRALQSAQDPTVEISRARAVAEIAQTIIGTAKVEIDYLRVNGGGESDFIDAVGRGNLPSQLQKTRTPASALPDGITGITQHRMKG